MVVPVKDFALAKSRLAPIADVEQRAALARRMAGIVIAAAAPLPVLVVCDAPVVADWAAALGAEAMVLAERGLSDAVGVAVRRLARSGVEHVVVAHADLPLATKLSWLATPGLITIVPDRHGDGSNVISVPTVSGFTFQYGPGSLERHVSEARRLGLDYRVVEDERLGWDVDEPADLEPLQAFDWLQDLTVRRACG